LGGSSERERARRVVALETVMVPAGHEPVIKSGFRYCISLLLLLNFTDIGQFLDAYNGSNATHWCEQRYVRVLVYRHIRCPGIKYSGINDFISVSANQGCFAQPGEVGRTNMGTHKIKLLDDKPVREPPRRIPMYKRQALEDEVKKLQDRGLIIGTWW
jgi:hypothetical protein